MRADDEALHFYFEILWFLKRDIAIKRTRSNQLTYLDTVLLQACNSESTTTWKRADNWLLDVYLIDLRRRVYVVNCFNES